MRLVRFPLLFPEGLFSSSASPKLKTYRNVTPREERISTLCLFLLIPLEVLSAFGAEPLDKDLYTAAIVSYVLFNVLQTVVVKALVQPSHSGNFPSTRNFFFFFSETAHLGSPSMWVASGGVNRCWSNYPAADLSAMVIARALRRPHLQIQQVECKLLFLNNITLLKGRTIS